MAEERFELDSFEDEDFDGVGFEEVLEDIWYEGVHIKECIDAVQEGIISWEVFMDELKKSTENILDLSEEAEYDDEELDMMSYEEFMEEYGEEYDELDEDELEEMDRFFV